VKILLCIAGMPYAEGTVSFTGTIARATGASVTLLHVLRRGERREKGKQILEVARQGLEDLEAEVTLREGDPVRRILAEAQKGTYDLIVVGANQHPGPAERLLGSVSLQIVQRAPAPVLISRATSPSLGRVLICTGGLDVAMPVIEAGARLAQTTHARVTLLHVATPAPEMYAALEEVQETLPELLRTDTPIARHLRAGAEILAQHQVSAELRLRYGVASDEVLQEAREGQYDLVVIGASGTAGQWRKWLLGDVTRLVADAAPCSVLVVRPKEG